MLTIKELLTLFTKVVRLLVDDISGPPLWLGLFRVSLLTRSNYSTGLATVRMVCLLARLNKLDESLGDLAAVQLLEVLESILVVLKNFLSVSNFNAEGVGGRRLRGLFDGFRVRDGPHRSLDLAGEIFMVPTIRIKTDARGLYRKWLTYTFLKKANARAHTANEPLLVSDLGSKNLQEVLTHNGSENSETLIVNRSRLGHLEIAHVVHVDQGIVRERES